MGSKSLAVAQYLVDQAPTAVTPMKLLKLVYIAHGYMLGMHGAPLLDEQVQAWKFGPTVASVYQAVRDYCSSPVQTVVGAKAWGGEFTSRELAVMDTVLERYGRVNAVALSGATHRPGTPWAITWSSHEQNTEISNDLITHFYRKLITLPVHSSL